MFHQGAGSQDAVTQYKNFWISLSSVAQAIPDLWKAGKIRAQVEMTVPKTRWNCQAEKDLTQKDES
jgi:hypothetical protein